MNPVAARRGARGRFRFFRELAEAAVQALRAVVAHRLRSGLSVLGIGIGVLLVIVIQSVSAGLDSSFAEQLKGLGPTTLYVATFPFMSDGDEWWRYRNRPRIGKNELDALQARAKLPEAVVPLTFQPGITLTHGSEQLQNIFIRGTSQDFLATGGWAVRKGRFLTALDEDLGTDSCVIGADVADGLFKQADPLGITMTVGNSARCTVVGVLERRGNSFGQSMDAVVILPLRAFYRAFGSKRMLLLAVVAPPDKMQQTQDEVTGILRQARGLSPEQDDNFNINRQDQMLKQFEAMSAAVKLVALLVGAIALVVAGVGIMNILLVSVKERTREIGVRRALGARRGSILMQFLCEALVVSCLGGVAGTVLGLSLARLAAWLTPVPAGVTAGVVIFGVGFSAFIGLVFGIFPAWSAAALQPIEALRHE